jgi:hypothetical protein
MTEYFDLDTRCRDPFCLEFGRTFAVVAENDGWASYFLTEAECWACGGDCTLFYDYSLDQQRLWY